MAVVLNGVARTHETLHLRFEATIAKSGLDLTKPNSVTDFLSRFLQNSWRTWRSVILKPDKTRAITDCNRFFILFESCF